MTVRELIDKLAAMPQDAVVVYDRFSDCSALEDDQPKLVKAEDKKIILRNGLYMDYQAHWWPETEEGRRGEVPVFVTVVRFPDN